MVFYKLSLLLGFLPPPLSSSLLLLHYLRNIGSLRETAPNTPNNLVYFSPPNCSTSPFKAEINRTLPLLLPCGVVHHKRVWIECGI